MNEAYFKARKRVKQIKSLYIHLIVFLLVNSFLVFNLITAEKSKNLDFFVWLILTTIITWSIGLLIHAWCAFQGRILFSKNWEEKKIQEFMNKDVEKLHKYE
jgi:protein-S-isoprenylcysteine O-methyltransferase Ste14